MCGIVAYIGLRDAFPVLIDGLYRLEYRGYDSAGVTILGSRTHTIKKRGKVKLLDEAVDRSMVSGTVGMGHTRWATHGEPNDLNAHPHLSSDGTISIVHNGIIENYKSLKGVLKDLGYTFKSDTDTEVLAHLIQEYRDSLNLALADAVRSALKMVVGAYAVVVADNRNKDFLIGARQSSPLVLGVGEGELFLASDVTPIAGYTNRFVFLEDGQLVALSSQGKYTITDLDEQIIDLKVQEMDVKVEEFEKEGYPHFMLKEIFQQPRTVADSMRGRLNAEKGWISVGGLRHELDRISRARKITLVACGTSWHTALIAEYLFEDLARIPCEVEYASEFRYRNPIINEEDVVLVISQSGETADTLAALELAKSFGALTYGIVNVIGSSIARMTDCGSYTHAGPEIGVASTKAFTSQLTILTLMAVQLGYYKKTISQDRYKELIIAMESIPNKIKRILDQNEKIKFIASEIKGASNALYLGRGYNFPVALEGALKLKEISYIHAEGYPAAEMKHGPIALIDMYMPVIVIGTNDSTYHKIVSNIEEIIARKGIVIAVTNEKDQDIKDLAKYTIEIPETDEALTPIISIVPLQLLAYHIAVMRGCNVDQPRNLAKSVTVE